MKPLLITSAATAAALVIVLSTRVVIPALVVLFRAIEASFAPEEPVIPKALPVSVTPVAVVPVPSERRQLNEDKPAPRKARRRKPSAKTLAAIQAIA